MIELSNKEAANVLEWQLKYVSQPIIAEAIKMGINALKEKAYDNNKIKEEMILNFIKVGAKVYYSDNNEEIIEDTISSITLNKEGLLLIKTNKNNLYTEEDIGENLFILRELLEAKLEKNQNQEELHKENGGLSIVIKEAYAKYNHNHNKKKSLEEVEIEYLDGFDADGDGYSDGHELRNGTDKSKDDVIIREK